MRGIIIKIMATMAVIITAIVPAFGANERVDTPTVGDVFVNLPLKTLSILSKSTRLDMLDYYYAADSIYRAKNSMEGISELVKVTPDFLEVKITPVSQLEIGMLHPGNRKDPVAVIAYTISGEHQAADTDVSFIDDKYQEMPRKKYLEYPDVLDFFNVKDKETKDMIEQLVPFPTIKFSISPSSNDLKAELTVGEFMGQENYEKIKGLMKPSLLFRWDGHKYRLIK